VRGRGNAEIICLIRKTGGIIKQIFVTERSQVAKLLIACSLSIVCMLADFQYQQFDKFRVRVSKIVYPLQMLVDAPFSGYEQVVTYLRTRAALQVENAVLHQEDLLLKGQLQKMQSLEIENNRLRQLLDATAGRKDKLSVANILHIEPDPYSQQVVINRGKAQGVVLGQPVIDASGVVGAIISVDALTSKAILVTDANFAVPVENTRNGLRAIVIGTGSRDTLELQHVPNTVDIEVHDLLVTSGFGGRYPFGYPVGEVLAVERDPGKPFATIYVKPKADLARCREILLVQANKESSALSEKEILPPRPEKETKL